MVFDASLAVDPYERLVVTPGVLRIGLGVSRNTTYTVGEPCDARGNAVIKHIEDAAFGNSLVPVDPLCEP